jgi:hypothetical protein
VEVLAVIFEGTPWESVIGADLAKIFEKDGERTEAHMNLLVRGSHDEGIYCVDVGIVQAAVVPEKVDRKVKWVCVPKRLATLARRSETT